MPTKAFSQAKLLGTDNTISVTSLSADIPITEKLATVDDLPSTGVIGEQAFVQATNRLYIWNGSGWYNIALINTTPTWDSGGQPAAAYELSADSPQTATTITLAASDPEGLSIDYSYVTSGSMDSMATISQDSSVFTITPKTLAQLGGEGNEGPYTGSITFRASDGVNILPQVSSFTLKFITLIENGKYTIMHVNAIAASDNNNITDTSTNNHSITVNGDAHAGTFSPYRSGGYSIYFDGTSGIRSDPSTGSTLQGATTFTVEFWYNTKTITSGNKVIWGSRNYTTESNTDDTIGRMFQNGGNLYYNVNASTVVLLNSVISADTWYYIALVVDSGALSLYLDGTRVATATYTSPNGSDIIAVGHTANTPQQYIADFRINTAAEYSGTNHTVPTESLPSTSDTVFHLTKGYHGEWSLTSLGTNFTTPVITPFSPYDYLEYSAADHGGSIYFDGTGDNLQLPSVLPAGAFTVSCWVYFNTEDTAAVWAQGTGGNAGRTSIQVLSSRRFFFAIGDTNVTSGEGDFTPKSWYYIEAQYSGSQIELFINGFSIGTASTTTNPQNTNFRVGTLGSAWDSSYELDGYVSDLKVVSGTPSGSSTVPTAPQSSSGTSLHIKGTDASIIDTAQSTHVRCVGSAAGTSSPVKFPGTHSLSLPGFGHWMPLRTNNGARLSGTEDWTVEAWVYPTSRQSYSVVVSCGSSFALALGMVSGNFHVYNNAAGGFTDTDVNYGTYDIPANQWTHLAATRVSGNWYCYVDGTLRYQKTGGSWQSHVMNETTQYTIGALDGYSSFSGNERWYGNIQDVRITKGLARYTANFTPPTAPLEG